MYARIARFEGMTGEQARKMAEDIRDNASSGPPEGVPATGLSLLVDADAGRVLAISMFESEEDLRRGDEALDAMSPPEDSGARRAAVERYEVAVELRSQGA